MQKISMRTSRIRILHPRQRMRIPRNWRSLRERSLHPTRRPMHRQNPVPTSRHPKLRKRKVRRNMHLRRPLPSRIHLQHILGNLHNSRIAMHNNKRLRLSRPSVHSRRVPPKMRRHDRLRKRTHLHCKRMRPGPKTLILVCSTRRPRRLQCWKHLPSPQLLHHMHVRPRFLRSKPTFPKHLQNSRHQHRIIQSLRF